MRTDQTTAAPRSCRRAAARLHCCQAESNPLVGSARFRGRTGVSHRVLPRRARGGAAVECMTRRLDAQQALLSPASFQAESQPCFVAESVGTTIFTSFVTFAVSVANVVSGEPTRISYSPPIGAAGMENRPFDLVTAVPSTTLSAV
jgi:hypothetical protein